MPARPSQLPLIAFAAVLLTSGCEKDPLPYYVFADTEAADATEGDTTEDVTEDATEEDVFNPGDAGEDASDATLDAGEDTTPDAGEDTTPDVPPDADTTNIPPNARIACTLREAEETPSAGSPLPLGDTLVCSAAESSDPDGSVIEYRWSLSTRPDDSETTATPNDRETTSVYLDAVGSYEIELMVVDERGALSAPATLRFEVASAPELRVELTWTMPGLESLPSAGAPDLDLHFLHDNGCWEHTTWDCHWRNTNPNGGVPTSTLNNPFLVPDAEPGFEVLTLQELEPDAIYTIGVHYHFDNEHGPALASVRVFLDDTLVVEETDVALENFAFGRGQWWVVAEVNAAERYYTVLDEISDTVPSCGE